MRRDKYQSKKRAKGLALLVVLVLLLGCGIGGTLAWLMDTTGPVTNTFTVGNIDITLDEAKVDQNGNFLDEDGEIVAEISNAMRVTGNEYKALPGKTYAKDPTLTVKKGNEKCYLFVKFEEIDNPATYYSYDSVLDDGVWKNDGVPSGVWYTIVDATAADAASDTVFYLLKDNKIQVRDTVTADMMTAAAAAKLQWTAYAVQYMNDTTGFTPAQAWDIAQDGTLSNN